MHHHAVAVDGLELLIQVGPAAFPTMLEATLPTEAVEEVPTTQVVPDQQEDEARLPPRAMSPGPSELAPEHEGEEEEGTAAVLAATQALPAVAATQALPPSWAGGAAHETTQRVLEPGWGGAAETQPLWRMGTEDAEVNPDDGGGSVQLDRRAPVAAPLTAGSDMAAAPVSWRSRGGTSPGIGGADGTSTQVQTGTELSPLRPRALVTPSVGAARVADDAGDGNDSDVTVAIEDGAEQHQQQWRRRPKSSPCSSSTTTLGNGGEQPAACGGQSEEISSLGGAGAGEGGRSEMAEMDEGGGEPAGSVPCPCHLVLPDETQQRLPLEDEMEAGERHTSPAAGPVAGDVGALHMPHGEEPASPATGPTQAAVLPVETQQRLPLEDETEVGERHTYPSAAPVAGNVDALLHMPHGEEPALPAMGPTQAAELPLLLNFVNGAGMSQQQPGEPPREPSRAQPPEEDVAGTPDMLQGTQDPGKVGDALAFVHQLVGEESMDMAPSFGDGSRRTLWGSGATSEHPSAQAAAAQAESALPVLQPSSPPRDPLSEQPFQAAQQPSPGTQAPHEALGRATRKRSAGGVAATSELGEKRCSKRLKRQTEAPGSPQGNGGEAPAAAAVEPSPSGRTNRRSRGPGASAEFGLRAQQVQHRVQFSLTGSKGSDKERERLAKKVQQLGGTTVPDDAVDFSVLCATGFRRTKKMMVAMAMGTPVVTTAWLDSSTAAGTFMDPWRYLVVDPDQEAERNFSLSSSLEKARQQPLMQGLRVELHSSILEDKTGLAASLRDIVEAAGGCIEDRVVPDAAGSLLLVHNKMDAAEFGKEGRTGHRHELVFDGVVRQCLERETHRVKPPQRKRGRR